MGVQAPPAFVRNERELIGIALALGASHTGRPTESEQEHMETATRVPDTCVAVFHEAIARGEDPLGEALCRLRSPTVRRPMGATYTPKGLVAAMTAWGALRSPARVVDPGAGSGRFVVAAGRAISGAELVAVEIDPVAALLTRAHLAAAGLADRARVEVEDYRTLKLAREETQRGATLFIGNPPYVRHHAIERSWKGWFLRASRELGIDASGLAGLHAHFFLATAMHARTGDSGIFVTAAEWLDVNYGSVVRKLLAGPLGGRSVHLIEPTALPFEDAATTGVVTCFTPGDASPTLRLSRVGSVDAHTALDATPGIDTSRQQLADARRWTPFTRAPSAARQKPEGFVELGEICRVHRGQVTGANRLWVAGEHSEGLPESVLFHCVTRARDLFDARASGHGRLRARQLRRVIDLPVDLEVLTREERDAIDRFLRTARTMGGDGGFIATHRRAWWSVGLRPAAPILATYMARRVPAFVRNPEGVRHLNIAHGLYPREPMSDAQLDVLARSLAERTSLNDGRTYAGGLTKFEPREMERLLVPSPALLTSLAGQ